MSSGSQPPPPLPPTPPVLVPPAPVESVAASTVMPPAPSGPAPDDPALPPALAAPVPPAPCDRQTLLMHSVPTGHAARDRHSTHRRSSTRPTRPRAAQSSVVVHEPEAPAAPPLSALPSRAVKRLGAFASPQANATVHPSDTDTHAQVTQPFFRTI